MQNQLNNVQQVQATASAFAAVLVDGSVVTWGNAEVGADSSAVQTQLKKRMCSRFKPLVLLLLPFLAMDPLCPGVVLVLVVTVVLCNVN